MFDRFFQLLAKERHDVLESLAAGNAADYAAYRQLVGRIEGLDTAARALTRMIDDDDRREK